MELAEWLVHWAVKLVSRVRCSIRLSSMMHILHFFTRWYKNLSSSYMAEKKFATTDCDEISS